MERMLRLIFLGSLCLLPGAHVGEAWLQQGPALYVNSTLDIPIEAAHCLPGQPCTFRAAIEKAQSFGAAVRVCFEGNCPPGARPLTSEDPNYDPATGKWWIRTDQSFQPYMVTGDGMVVDFTTHIEGWSGPQDNRLVLDGGDIHNHLMVVEGTNNTLAGLEIRGSFKDTAILVRRGATDNQFGPGLVFAGFEHGNGMRIIGAGTMRNHVVGSWCGITTDGSGEVVEDGLLEDCIHIAEGASENVVGGPEPEDRNVLSGSKLGFGVSLHDPATRDNVVQGNFIGADPTGTQAVGNQSGIAIFEEATGTEIRDNVLSGNRNAGVFTSDASTRFGRSTSPIENNIIGADVSGEKPLPNGGYGVKVEALSKDLKVAHNLITFNGTGGVSICGELTKNNTVTENSITDNYGHAIDLCEGANEGVQPPALTVCDRTSVRGTACPGCRVEVFSDPVGEAAVFEGAVVAGDDGSFVLPEIALLLRERDGDGHRGPEHFRFVQNVLRWRPAHAHPHAETGRDPDQDSRADIRA